MSDAFDRSIVESTAHRPWPMPSAPWLMTQSWNSLLFAHWRVDAAEMRRAVPDVFDLDLFDGEAWLGVVPFYMTNVGLTGRAGAALAIGVPGTERSHLCPSGGPARGTSSAWTLGAGSPSRRRGRYSTCRMLCRGHERRAP